MFSPQSTETVTGATVIGRMLERFSSGNEIEVERAHITKQEWSLVLRDLLKIHARHLNYECPKCRATVTLGDSVCSVSKMQHVQRCGKPHFVHCQLPNGHDGPHKPVDHLISWEG